jgi:hypothetical protein
VKRRATKTSRICDVVSTLLGDYRLGEKSKTKKGAILGWTASQIAINTGIPEKSVYRLLKEMLEHGIIEKRGEEYRVNSRIVWNLYDYQGTLTKERDKSLWLSNLQQ